jgi:anhydro-N-acetylmuramic acid kinase
MIVAGIMSGTSADGIDVALVRIGERPLAAGSRGRGRPRYISLKLLAHLAVPYPARVRRAVLDLMNAPHASVADLARLNFLLGELYAEAVLAAQRKFRLKAELVGCHGQTLYHQGEHTRFLGRRLAATWQTGEAAVIAARVGVPVVSDFRPADMAAGGKGAPLVPFLDYLLYRSGRVGRVVQNIGGIANLSFIPAGAQPEQVLAFDTGPGNMVIDAVTEQLFSARYDWGGRIAAAGTVLDSVVEKILRRRFFRRKPPKTAGREEFGREFVREFLQVCGRTDKRNVVATATALTARSISDALRRFVSTGKLGGEFIISGGGAKNSTLMAMLGRELEPLRLQLKASDAFGLPAEAKEAVAFALLAYETWHRRPSNVRSATGAVRPAVLGKISYP